MKRYQNTLLAGVAALALTAGTGLASAQDQAKDRNGGPQGGQPHAGQPMTKGATQPLQQNAKGNGPSGGQQANRPNGQETQRVNRGNNNADRGGTATNAQQQQHGRRSTAQRQQTLRGLQGNATGQGSNADEHGTTTNAGANVKFSQEQRTKIHDTVINAHDAPRVAHVDFALTVGTVIPRDRIQIVPVPETLVDIQPSWRGLLYFVYEDEIVIVNPNDMRIVAVIAV